MIFPKDHEKYLDLVMTRSIENVRDHHGGPFAALIVMNDQIISCKGNEVLQTNDPTAHAEVTAIRHACQAKKNYFLEGAVLYSSCEPCPMCLSAIYWAHIQHVFFCASRSDADQYGFNDHLIYEELFKKHSERSIPFQQFNHSQKLTSFKLWQSLQELPRY